MFGDLLDFICDFIMKNEKKVPKTRKKTYLEKCPAGHFKLNISCYHSVPFLLQHLDSEL